MQAIGTTDKLAGMAAPGQTWPRFCAFLAAHDHITLAFTVLALWCFIFQEYFFFNKLFLFNLYAVDSITQFYPIEYYRIKHLASLNAPYWSFQFALGENVYHLATALNPFNAIYLAFGAEHLSEAIYTATLLKFLFAALFFQAFLKIIHFSPLLAFTGALAYTFSGYMILNCHWYHYANYAVFLAMFLYCFELWYQDGKWMPLLLVIGPLSIKIELQFLQIYVYTFFYILYRLVQDNGWKLWKIIRLHLKLALLYAFGLLTWAYFLIPHLSGFLASDRVRKAVADVPEQHFIDKYVHLIDKEQLSIYLARFFSPDALHSWFNYPNMQFYFPDSTMYVGLLAVLLFFTPFFLPHKGRHILWIFPCITALVLLFPVVLIAGNAFVSTAFKYQSFYLGFYALIVSMFVLRKYFSASNVEAMRMRKAILASTLLACICISCALLCSKKINTQVIFISFSFILLIMCSLLLYNREKRAWCKYLACGLCLVELVFSARHVAMSLPGAIQPFFEQRHELYFNQNTNAAIRFIKEQDSGFFRIENNFRDQGLNDAIVQDYFGTLAYLGFPSSGLRAFFKNYGLGKSYSSYRRGLEGNKALQNLLGVKYFLYRKTNKKPGGGPPAGFAPLRSFGDVHIYVNERANFGQLFFQTISPDAFPGLAPAEKQRLIPQAVVSETRLPEKAEGAEAAQGQFRLKSWQEDHFLGEAELNHSGLLFFPIPLDVGWQLFVDGRKTPLLRLNYAFMGAQLNAGRHEIELRYRPPFLALSWTLTALCLLFALALWHWRPRIAAC